MIYELRGADSIKNNLDWRNGVNSDTLPATLALEAGLPLTSEIVPRSLIVSCAKNKPILVPHIFEFVSGHFIVSVEMRDLICSVAPTDCEFHKFELVAPASMCPSASYFYLDVVKRAQNIDWDASRTEVRSNPDKSGKQVIIINSSAKFREGYVFKVDNAGGPDIWHEQDIYEETLIKFAIKKIFI
jgi:hypothetical protein